MNRLGQQVSQCEVEAQRQSQVNEAMDRLMKSIGACQETLEQLTQRLAPILVSCPPEVEKGHGVPTPVRAPLADVLHDRADSVDRIMQQIQSLLNRCEL